MNDDLDFNQYLQWFQKYCLQFQTIHQKSSHLIVLKINHTYNVIKIIEILGEKLKLSQDNLNIARIIGLFHDLGRYNQLAHYHTFNDACSVNHAKIGVQEILREKILSKMTHQTQNIIFCAIMNHNQRILSKNIQGNALMHCQLIRDADKLDIYHIICEEYRKLQEKNTQESKSEIGIEHLGLINSDLISDSILQHFIKNEQIALKDLKTIGDLKTLHLSWIYDFNFQSSLEILQKYKYIDMILDFLPNNLQKQIISKRIQSFFEEKRKTMVF